MVFGGTDIGRGGVDGQNRWGFAVDFYFQGVGESVGNGDADAAAGKGTGAGINLDFADIVEGLTFPFQESIEKEEDVLLPG